MNNSEIEKLLKQLIPNVNSNYDIEYQGGGLTNNNYKVNINNDCYVLRTIKKSSEKMINRLDECKNNKIAEKLGIDRSYFIIREDGTKLSKFLGDGITLRDVDFKEEKILMKLCKELRKLHNSGEKFENKFSPLEIIIKYENILKASNWVFYKDYLEIRKKIIKLLNVLSNIGVNEVPCHNDLVPENCIIHDGEISLIDWEYSGMNDFMWDLASFSIECEFNEEDDFKLLSAYFYDDISSEDKMKLNIYKVLQDFIWSIWGNIKVIEGEEFSEYAFRRYDRCKHGIKNMKIN